MGLCEPRPDCVPDAGLTPLGQLGIHGLPRRKVGWEIAPPTICVHHMHDRLEHQPPRVVVGMPHPSDWWEQWFEPPPHHVQHIHLGGLLSLRHLLRWPIPRRYAILAPAVMVIARPGLMPAPPRRPAQKCLCATLNRQNQLPEQMADFRTA
jgi:hypothetical protein